MSVGYYVDALHDEAVMLFAVMLDGDWAEISWGDVGEWWPALYGASKQSVEIGMVFKSLKLPPFSLRRLR